MTEQNMQTNGAVILGVNDMGITVSAASARISTQQGSAMDIFAKSTDNPNNLNLLKKVLASGHKSVIEHTVFSLAFNNVSVFAEQFIIEFRLASYTVKSRRYVDYSNEGYYVPEGLGDMRDEYCSFVRRMFDTYAGLLELGIPKEDARFVLPYGFYSNFYCTLNARELIYMISCMLWGRGRVYPEIRALGAQLKEQFDEYFPGIIESEQSNFVLSSDDAVLPKKYDFSAPVPAVGCPELVSCTSGASEIVGRAYSFNSYTDAPFDTDRHFCNGQRIREYEALNLCFVLHDLSLAAITHLVRHRLQTVLVPELSRVFDRAGYVLPDTVAASADARKLYEEAFALSRRIAARCQEGNVDYYALAYMALAGNTLDVFVNMDGRQFMHFITLRTCNRAQWEIRDVAKKALQLAKSAQPYIWDNIGPGCYMYGKCPEGRMSCGKASEVIAEFKKK